MMRDVGVKYVTNGTGRDTYIYNDNGGFNAIKLPRSQFKPASISLGHPSIDYKRAYNKEKSPVIHSRAVGYRTDGSGRDGYIVSNNGGLSSGIRKFTDFKTAFKNSLRSDQPDVYYLHRRHYLNGNRVTSI
jgi:hypothetical protein